jgi:hypothetical protein
MLFGLMLVLFATAPALDLLGRRFDAFEVRNVFLGVLFLDFVLGAINSLYFLRSWVSASEFSAWINLTLVWANISLACFYIGYYLPPADSLAALLPKLSRSWRGKRVTVAVAVLTAIGLAMHVALMESVGGFSYYLAHANRSSTLLVGQYYLLLPAVRLPMVAAIMCYVHGRVNGSKRYENAGIALFALNMLKQVTLGGRTGLVLDALALWAVVHYTPRARPFRRRLARVILVPAVAAFLSVLLAAATVLHTLGPQAFSASQAQSGSVSGSARGVRLALSSLGVQGIGELIVERFVTLEAFVRVVARAGRAVQPQLGRTFLDVFYGAVPRTLWPEKPYEWPVRFAQNYLDFDTTTGLAPIESPVATWPGELYINFLGPGLILGMFLTGIASRSFYAYLLRNRNPAVLLFYILGLLFFFPFLDGGFAMAVFSFVAAAVPAGLACAFLA